MLWRHADFLKLWAAETISVFGSQMTLLALPLTAALTLAATPAQMGLLMAAETAPFLLIGLLVGVWVDRLPRRPIMVLADLGRALVLGWVPLAAMLGWLTIEQLYAVALLTGGLTVFFDVAYQAYLPALVEREALVEGNSKLEVSRSSSQIVGPGLAGGLVELVGPPFTILIDAVSFLVSALLLGAIRRPEPSVPPASARPGMWTELREGLGVVFGNPTLRGIAGCTATWNLFGNIAFAVFVLYTTQQLGLSPTLLGLIFAAGGGGALLGAVLAGPAAARFGVGRTIIGAQVLGGLSVLVVPLVGGPPLVATAVLAISWALGGITNTVYNITQVSLRQRITPDRLQGRMNATMRFIVWGTLPVAGLVGGLLGEVFGLWPTLVIGVLGAPLAGAWLWWSPLARRSAGGYP